VQTWVATCAIGTPAHSWQLTAHGKTPVAHKGMIHAAKVMAGTAKLLIEDPSILAAAQEEHRKHLARTPYVCPIPKEATPPIIKQAA
jgi:aminobenzoyl-glutamate utilization protein B